MSERSEAMEPRQDEALLRTLVEGIPGAVFRRGAEQPWRFEYVSDGIEPITGYRAVDLVPPGRLADVVLAMPDDLLVVTDAVSRAVSTGQPYRVEYRIRHADGSARWVEDHGRPGRDGDRRRPWIDGVMFDVTERKQVELALIEERARLGALMDNTPDQIYFKDADGRFIMISKALATHFGLSDPAQAVGKTDFDFFTEEHARRCLRG